jgi:hypothetical protein
MPDGLPDDIGWPEVALTVFSFASEAAKTTDAAKPDLITQLSPPDCTQRAVYTEKLLILE